MQAKKAHEPLEVQPKGMHKISVQVSLAMFTYILIMYIRKAIYECITYIYIYSYVYVYVYVCVYVYVLVNVYMRVFVYCMYNV